MKSNRPFLRVSLILIVAIAMVWGCDYVYWAKVNHKFTTVTEGRVYRSAAMPPEVLQEMIQDHDIKTVIDLRTIYHQDDIDTEHRMVTSVGRRHIHLPSKQVPEDDTVRDFLNILDNPDVYPVLIHCYHGEGRAVLFSAIYRIEYEGWDNERARRATRFITWRSSFSADAEKGRFVAGYTSQRASGQTHGQNQ